MLYTSAPLEEELELTGTPTAVLHLSSTADVAYFRVKLIDVAPDGTSKLVRYGGLSATHRNSHSDPEPLQPDQIYQLEVKLKAMSYVFSPGHRIRVAITSSDIQNAWPTPRQAVNTIYRGGSRPSHIILPIVPPQNPRLPLPDLKILPNADPEKLNRPSKYAITRDLVNQTTTVHLITGSEETGDLLGSSFTVSSADPANAVLKARKIFTVNHPNSRIQVEANELTASDISAFRHLVQIEILVNGKRHFQKSWSVTIPRKLN